MDSQIEAGLKPAGPYRDSLGKRTANYVALSPLSFLPKAAAIHPHRIALIHGDWQSTWAETYDRCRRLASALASHGVGPGDTVAVLAPNVPAIYEAHFGVPMTGAVVNTLNVRLDAEAIAFQLTHGEAKVLITDREFSAVVKRALSMLERRPLVSGSIAIPVDLRTPNKPETIIPTDGAIFANLVTSDVQLGSFFPAGQAPATGTARFSITGSGSISQPSLQVIFAARGIKAKAAAALAPMNVDANVTLLGKQLSLQTRVAQGTAAPLVSGSIALPIDLRTPSKPETLIPEDGPIFANLVASDIQFGSFFPAGKAPATGTGRLTITGSGSIDQPNVRVIVAARDLRSRAAANLAPATLDADCTLLGQQLSLKAKLAQPSFSTVEIAGTVPLPLKQILHDRKIDPNSPVQLSVRMPKSSIAVVTRFVPAIRYLQGTTQVAVDIAGTIAKPSLSGAALIDLPAIRLANPDMPSVSGFRGDLRFSGDRLTIGQFGGNLSGGSFNLTGSILFANLANPVFDLRMISKKALVARNESVTVRVDSDVRVSGPLAGASVTGDVGSPTASSLSRSKSSRSISRDVPLPRRPPRLRPIPPSIRPRCATGNSRFASIPRTPSSSRATLPTARRLSI